MATTVLLNIAGLAHTLSPFDVISLGIIVTSVVAFAPLVSDLFLPSLPRPDRLSLPVLPDPTRGMLTTNEKARAIFADRSWGCHVTVTAGGATSRTQLAYSRSCLEDVTLILGEEAAQLLCARHRNLFGPHPTPSDDGMERLSNDLWKLSNVAWAQRSPFSERALIEIDRRLPQRK